MSTIAEVRLPGLGDQRRELAVELLKRHVRLAGISCSYDADIEYLERPVLAFADDWAQQSAGSKLAGGEMQGARRELAVEMLLQHVRSSGLSDDYDADIEHLGSAVLAFADQWTQAVGADRPAPTRPQNPAAAPAAPVEATAIPDEVVMWVCPACGDSDTIKPHWDYCLGSVQAEHDPAGFERVVYVRERAS